MCKILYKAVNNRNNINKPLFTPKVLKINYLYML
nr:MAG TPA: hypothetical protein [Caudoviricetes sp.]